MPLLKILSKSEITEFDTPPVFNHEERKKFFSLASGLKQSWGKLRMLRIKFYSFSNSYIFAVDKNSSPYIFGAGARKKHQQRRSLIV